MSTLGLPTAEHTRSWLKGTWMSWIDVNLTLQRTLISLAWPLDLLVSKLSPLCQQQLALQNERFENTAGVSCNNHTAGFRPAFEDKDTGMIYTSCYADGTPAVMHLLDGLPEELVVSRGQGGHVMSVKPSVVAGFVRNGRFYTREQAIRALQEC